MLERPRKHVKQYPSARFFTLALCVILGGMAPRQTHAEAKAPDPSGTWSWTTPAPAAAPHGAVGRPPGSPSAGLRGLERKTVLTLRFDSNQLSGSIFTQLSQPRTNAVPIMNARLEGDMISFTVTRELNGKKYIQQFSGKLSADTITGKVEFERDGQPQSADWLARRVVEGKEEAPHGRAAPGAFRPGGTNSPPLRRPPRPAP